MNKMQAILKIVLFSLFALILANCQSQTPIPAKERAIRLLSVPANATPTPTPFLPVAPTPTYIPTAMPTLPPTAIAAETNDTTNIAPVPLLNLPEKQVNILLLGSDQRAAGAGYRTDTIMLVSINTTAKTVTVVSFPRDLYVYIPGWTHQRINTAMFHGGFELLANTLEYNFGVKPAYYILINFDAFIEVVDSLGGIDVDVPKDLTEVSIYGTFYVPQGINHMSGETALYYARSRMSTNDFDRARRQQEVVEAVVKKLMSMNALENASDLYDIYINNVTTNLTWSEITPLIPLSVHFRDTSQIRRYVIGPKQVSNWITPGGAMVLLPRSDAVTLLLKEALESSQ